jgi:hypothetical protein
MSTQSDGPLQDVAWERHLPARILQFVSRVEELRLRGQRNYSRYMFVVKGFVDPNGPERAQWRKETAQESLWDAEWNERHGPAPGGARILQSRHEQDAMQVADESRPGSATSAQEH